MSRRTNEEKACGFALAGVVLLLFGAGMAFGLPGLVMVIGLLLLLGGLTELHESGLRKIVADPTRTGGQSSPEPGPPGRTSHVDG